MVLDEATCHLDPAAESLVEAAFAARRGGTLIVVAHRMSSAARASRILVLDGDRTAMGSHAHLLRTCSRYRELTGYWAEGSQPAGLLGEADRFDPGTSADLAFDPGEIVADGADRQPQAAGDLGGR
jgi:ATP-binding cassette, subfamily C, bacterial